MTAKGFDLGNYVEVADRIVAFYQRHPEGRIAEVGRPEVVSVGPKTFIGVTVAVYRAADDPQPCVGTAWEPFPGATSYTRDSEMMNAATSAIGRALVAAGILAKGEKVASREEIRNRSRKEADMAPASVAALVNQIEETFGPPQKASDSPMALPHEAPAVVDAEPKTNGSESASSEHEDRQPLYVLARTLKIPRTVLEVDQKIAKQSLVAVRRELILAHGRDCGISPCPHVAALAGMA